MVSSSSGSTEPGAVGPAPAVPRPASTVIVVRDGADGRPETFMVRRDPRSRFAADAYVFPGGTVQDDDYHAGGAPPCSGLTAEQAHRHLTERGSDPPESPAASLALHLAAIRELFEEAGILLARYADDGAGAALRADTCTLLAAMRAEVQQGRRRLSEVALDLRLELMPEALVYFSHWITPESSPRRFDTRFFVVEDRPGQTASHCGVETIDGAWLAPSEALRRFEAGAMTLVSVTVDHLRVLDRYRTAAELLAFARTKPVRTVRARRSRDGWDLGGNGAPW